MTNRCRFLTLAIGVALLLAFPVRAQKPETAQMLLRAAIDRETVDGDLKGAIAGFKAVVDRFPKDRAAVATALLHMAQCYQKLGDAQATAIYRRLVREFSDQAEAASIAQARLRQPRSPAAPEPTVQRLSDAPAGGAFSRVSRDGEYVSFLKDGNVFVRELSTGRVSQATFDAVEFDTPGEQYGLTSVFSPDGKRIAYQWYFGATNTSVLRIAAIGDKSTKPRTLFENADIEQVVPTDWSRDGRWISALLRRQDKTAQIALVSVADGSVRVLKSVQWSGAGGLRFSPDATRIAYHRVAKEGGFERNVFVISIDGSREVMAAASPGDDSALEWTSDGERLLIASDRGGGMGIWAARFENGTPRPSLELIKSDVGSINSKALTDAGTLYYDLAPAAANIYVAQLDASTGQLSSTPAQPIQQFKGVNTQPDWSPDGKHLSFVSRREIPSPVNVARPVIGILSMETGAVRELYPTLGYMGFPRWSPDGRYFVARGADLKGRSGIVTFDAMTGEGSTIAENGTCSGVPHWGPDSSSFFCYRFEEKEVAQVDARSGAILRTFPQLSQSVGVSPDGRYLLAAGRGDGSLKIAPLAGGEHREILRLPDGNSRFGNMTSFAWMPDSRHVVFAATVKGETGMWRLAIENGTPTKIKVDIAPVTWRVNARTGQVAFSPEVFPKLELWKMEHFLPGSTTRGAGTQARSRR